MFNKLSKYFNVLTILSLVFFGGGIWMILHNEISSGMTMSRYGNRGIGSINGYGLLFVGFLCLVAGIMIVSGKEDEENS